VRAGITEELASLAITFPPARTGVGGDRRAQRGEWGDAPGKTGRRKQVRKKMRIEVQFLPRQESTAGKASPCVRGGDPVREA
jgi:hypothetical protein